MNTLETKKENILNNLEKLEKKVFYLNKILEENRGKGFFKKIKKLFLLPKFYFFYALFVRYKIFYKKAWVNLFFDKKIYLNIEDIYNLILFLYKAPDVMDINIVKFFINKFKEDDVFYDIGANYGFYTALASEFCKEVHSFEPNPRIFECLKEGFKNDKNVFLNQVALSDKIGEVKLLLAGASSIVDETKLFLKSINLQEEIVCNTISLKEYLKSHKPPTIIKMDVEGAEYNVISGGLDFFNKSNPIIAMEVILSDAFGSQWRELSQKAVNLLLSCGYSMYLVDKEGKIFKTTYEDNVYKKDYDNFIFMKKI